MDEPSSSLDGFAGRLLRQPPLAHGVILSLFRLIWLCVMIIILGLLFLIAVSLNLKWVTLSALGLTIGCFVCHQILEMAALQVWKLRFVHDRFWIVAFRSFQNETLSYWFRNFVAPTLGCYGLVNVLGDESLFWSANKHNALFVDAIGDARFVSNVSDEGWRERVRAMISLSDLAVIDMTRPSVNLLWETACCIQFLPAHRIILIGFAGTQWPRILEILRKFLLEVLPGRAPSVDLLSPITYGDGLFMTLRFRLRIFRAMRAIKRLDSEVAGSGAWHPPKAAA